MWEPEGEAYRRSDEVALGAVLASVTVDGLAIETAALHDLLNRYCVPGIAGAPGVPETPAVDKTCRSFKS